MPEAKESETEKLKNRVIYLVVQNLGIPLHGDNMPHALWVQRQWGTRTTETGGEPVNARTQRGLRERGKRKMIGNKRVMAKRAESDGKAGRMALVEYLRTWPRFRSAKRGFDSRAARRVDKRACGWQLARSISCRQIRGQDQSPLPGVALHPRDGHADTWTNKYSRAA